MQKVQHLTDKELKILKYFYLFSEGHVRRIKKSTDLSEHTLLKYLANLEKKKILISKEQGNLKVYKINFKNLLVKSFFSYFDKQRLNEVSYKRQKAIKDFLEEIKGIKIPYFILLFGSTAKGTYEKTSDIDFIIVYEKYNKNISQKLTNLSNKILAERGIKINFILLSLNDFQKEKDNKKNYALQDALQTGYPIFGNELYYEVIW